MTDRGDAEGEGKRTTNASRSRVGETERTTMEERERTARERRAGDLLVGAPRNFGSPRRRRPPLHLAIWTDGVDALLGSLGVVRVGHLLHGEPPPMSTGSILPSPSTVAGSKPSPSVRVRARPLFLVESAQLGEHAYRTPWRLLRRAGQREKRLTSASGDRGPRCVSSFSRSLRTSRLASSTPPSPRTPARAVSAFSLTWIRCPAPCQRRRPLRNDHDLRRARPNAPFRYRLSLIFFVSRFSSSEKA